MDISIYFFLPLISAGIGWFTNFLAIKMLFYPREEKDFILFKLHGVFPKRQLEMARRQARLVSRELFSSEDIKKQVMASEMTTKIHEAIEAEIDNYLKEKRENMPYFLSGLISDSRIEKIRKKVSGEAFRFIPGITSKFIDKLDEVNVEELVYEKIKNYSSEKLEKMLMSVLKHELKHIEMAGGVLGFIVGLIQVLLILIIQG